MAVDEEGNEVTYTSRGGVQAWSRPGHLDPYRLTAISCTTQRVCLAVDDAGGTVVLSDGRWLRPSHAVPLGAMRAVSCTGRATCVAVDGDDAAVGTAT